MTVPVPALVQRAGAGTVRVMTIQQVLAIASMPGLPDAAIDALDGAGDSVRTVLAANRGLPPARTWAYARDRVPAVRRAALEHLDDPDLLAEAARGPRDSQLGVAANRCAPTEPLAELLHAPATQVVRLALANPASPTEDVLAAARTHGPVELFSRGPDALRAVGVGVVLRTHPEVAEEWADARDISARRSLARWPHLTPRTVRKFQAVGGKAGVRALALNPFVAESQLNPTPANRRLRQALEEALDGRDPVAACHGNAASQVALAQFGSPTLDLLLLDAPDLAPAAALAMLDRADPQIEPDVLMRLAERFGMLVWNRARRFSGIRREAAALYSRRVELLESAGDYLDDAATVNAELVEPLGNDPAAWRTLIRIARNESLAWGELATVATGITA